MLWSQLRLLGPCVHAPWVSLLQTPVLLPPILDLLWKDEGRPVGQTSCPTTDSLPEMAADCIFLSQRSMDSQGATSCQMLGLFHTTLQRDRVAFRCYPTLLPKDRQQIPLDEAIHLFGFTTKPYNLLKWTLCPLSLSQHFSCMLQHLCRS